MPKKPVSVSDVHPDTSRHLQPAQMSLCRPQRHSWYKQDEATAGVSSAGGGGGL